MKTSIMIAAVMITLRLLAEIAPGSHFMWGTWEMPARQPSSGYYGSWYSYAIYDAICYDENGNPYIVAHGTFRWRAVGSTLGGI